MTNNDGDRDDFAMNRTKLKFMRSRLFMMLDSPFSKRLLRRRNQSCDFLTLAMQLFILKNTLNGFVSRDVPVTRYPS